MFIINNKREYRVYTLFSHTILKQTVRIIIYFAEACLAHQRAVTIQTDSSNWHESLNNRRRTAKKNHSHAIRSTAAIQSSLTFLRSLSLSYSFFVVSQNMLFFFSYLYIQFINAPQVYIQIHSVCKPHTYVWLWVLAYVCSCFFFVFSCISCFLVIASLKSLFRFVLFRFVTIDFIFYSNVCPAHTASFFDIWLSFLIFIPFCTFFIIIIVSFSFSRSEYSSWLLASSPFFSLTIYLCDAWYILPSSII